jgi:hypothetical protein
MVVCAAAQGFPRDKADTTGSCPRPNLRDSRATEYAVNQSDHSTRRGRVSVAAGPSVDPGNCGNTTLSGAAGRSRRLDERRHHNGRSDIARSASSVPASEFSLEHILQHRLIEREIRHDTLELRVLLTAADAVLAPPRAPCSRTASSSGSSSARKHPAGDRASRSESPGLPPSRSPQYVRPKNASSSRQNLLPLRADFVAKLTSQLVRLFGGLSRQRDTRDAAAPAAPSTPHRHRRAPWVFNAPSIGTSPRPWLSACRQLVARVEYFRALSKSALVGVVSKKQFSNVSWPVLACSRSRSTFCSPFARSSSKTPATPWSNSLFQVAIYVAWTSYFWASSARVCSPRKASRATRALNAPPGFRPGRLMRFSPRRGRYLRTTEQASDSLYPTVRKSGPA